MAKELELIKKIYTKAINDKSPGATTTTNILIRDINSTLVGNHTFFYELLQNMHDVASENDGTVYIRLSGNNLLISHNGRHFDEENINSLCSYSASGTNSKAAEGNTTGYKDVGFKTVFGVANTVYVFSKAYKFKFDKQFFEKQTFSYPWQIIPIPVEDNEAKIFNYPDELVSFILICKNPQEIIARLNELVADPSWFLFLPRIRSIQFDVNGQKLLLDREENTKENTVCFYQNKTLYDKYVFMSYTENIPLDVFQQLQSAGDDVVPTKLKRETKTKITFAARTINDKLVTQKQGKLYCLLPIQHTTGLPFSINAPFLLSTNRNEILNSFWNRYLISFITRHYFKWLNALAMSNKLYADSILQMVDSEIPNKLLRFTQQLGTQVITEQSHAIKVRSEWGEGLEREPFIRGRNNEYLTILQATVDKTGFYHQLLTLPSPQNTVIVASEVEQQQSLLIFGNRQIDWEELITYLQGYFDYYKSENIKLLYVLQLLLQNQGVIGRQGIMLTLQKMNIILTSNGSLEKPTVAIFPLNLDVSTGLQLPTMVETSTGEFRKWLQDLGVTEKDYLAVLREYVVPFIEKEQVNEQNTIQIVRFLFYGWKNKLFKIEDFPQLRRVRLLTTENKCYFASTTYLSSSYGPEQVLERELPGCNFLVTPSYVENNEHALWKNFFLKLKVNQKIGLIKRSETCQNITDEYSECMPFYYNLATFKSITIHPFSQATITGDNKDKHIIDPFVTVTMYWLLGTSTAYDKLFWQSLLIENWNDIKAINKCELKRGRATDILPHFLIFLLLEKRILATNGGKYTIRDIYPPNFPVTINSPNFPIMAPIPGINFTEEQVKFFKFRTIDFAACYKFLQDAAGLQGENQIKQLKFGLQQLLLLELDPTQKQQLRTLKLLTRGASKKYVLTPVSQISYYETDEAPDNSKLWLGQLPGMKKEQMIRVCTLFDIPVVGPDMLIDKKDNKSTYSELINAMYQVFPGLAVIEAREYETVPLTKLHEIFENFRKLTLWKVDRSFFPKGEREELFYFKDGNFYIAYSPPRYDLRSTSKANYYEQHAKLVRRLADELGVETEAGCDYLRNALLHFLPLDNTHEDVQEVLLKTLKASDEADENLKYYGQLCDELARLRLRYGGASASNVVSQGTQQSQLAPGTTGLEPELQRLNMTTDPVQTDQTLQADALSTSPIETQLPKEFFEEPPETPQTPDNKAKKRERELVYTPGSFTDESETTFFNRSADRTNPDGSSGRGTGGSNQSKPRDKKPDDRVGELAELTFYDALKKWYQEKYNCTVQEFPNKSGFSTGDVQHPQKGTQRKITVSWTRRQGDKYAHYDFVIAREGDKKDTRHVEVKGSSQQETATFYVSRDELADMNQLRDKSRLFFIYNVGALTKPTILRVKDPIPQILCSTDTFDETIKRIKSIEVDPGAIEWTPTKRPSKK